MIRKQLYTIESTINNNNLINYSRLISNNKRVNVLYNKERDDNLTCIHLQTENFDKYYNTKFVELFIFKSINSLTPFLFDANEFDEDDEDDD